ncbi:hypothetical protein ACQPW1_08420 [Nocardia sp. CA-128927]|uniref:hypothetical protein n=1 Tax=Nocardia sp. CA-128927 TaxID=3239975 RepID=UPI003D96419F
MVYEHPLAYLLGLEEPQAPVYRPCSSGTFNWTELKRGMGIDYQWRGELTDDEVVELTLSHDGNAEVGWWDRVRPHSLGWGTARFGGVLVGFVNTAWDGAEHA